MSAEHPAGECYRCGYDLRGIPNDRPCPECGLLAERSRRITDELHDTRPRWLRAIALGVWTILLAILLLISVLLLVTVLNTWIPYQWWEIQVWIEVAGVHAAAVLFPLGVFLLTKPEGYAPADEADRLRRSVLRPMSLMPLLAVILIELEQVGYMLGYGQLLWRWRVAFEWFHLMAFVLAIVMIPLPALLFYQLRGLATRARSAHLAEHCAIVGIGASAAIAYAIALSLILPLLDRWTSDPFWLTRSTTALVLMLIATVAAALFVLWALYLMVRFAISFHRAARQLRHKWRRDDLAAADI